MLPIVGTHMKYPPVKGTYDILPLKAGEDSWRSTSLWNQIIGTLNRAAKAFGFTEVTTPILEHTSLFLRSAGEETDCSKELYRFQDKGNRDLSLRPELTAGVIRSAITNHLFHDKKEHKFFYHGPCFRYDRPQQGRYRQFYQFGIESIGDSSFYNDVEAILFLQHILDELGIKNTTLLINSIGGSETREHYIKALKSYLSPHLSSLSADSQTRFESNPLRILDSKNPNDKKLLEEAPTILSFLSDQEHAHFDQVQEHLSKIGVKATVDPFLVRGLDYYNDTVFEITSDKLGAQSSLGGGGRYDHLVEHLGGPTLPAVGFACGMERLIHTYLQQHEHSTGPSLDLYLVPLEEELLSPLFQLMHTLRCANISCEMPFSVKKTKKMLSQAYEHNPKFVLFYGEDERDNKQYRIKNCATKEEIDIHQTSLLTFLEGALNA